MAELESAQRIRLEASVLLQRHLSGVGRREVLRDARVGLTPRTIAVVSFVVLTGLAWSASAAPIELENDVGVAWQDSPNCILTPALCEPLVIGAPRLVPDMSNAGDLLQFIIDFHAMSVVLPSALLLNIADAEGNVVFRSDRPGEDTPLQLTYSIPLSDVNPNGPGRLPATDIVVELGGFNDFRLLPAGDLLFTVTFFPRLALPFNQVFDRATNNGRTQAVTLTVAGPGTVAVPEPATFVLLLAGLASVGLTLGWRRVSRMRASRLIFPY